MGLLAGKEQGCLALGITDSGVSMTTGSDGVKQRSGPCCPWWWGPLVVLESESWHPGISPPSVQIGKSRFCHLQLITVTDTNSDSKIISHCFLM